MTPLRAVRLSRDRHPVDYRSPAERQTHPYKRPWIPEGRKCLAPQTQDVWQNPCVSHLCDRFRLTLKLPRTKDAAAMGTNIAVAQPCTCKCLISVTDSRLDMAILPGRQLPLFCRKRPLRSRHVPSDRCNGIVAAARGIRTRHVTVMGAARGTGAVTQSSYWRRPVSRVVVILGELNCFGLHVSLI